MQPRNHPSVLIAAFALFLSAFGALHLLTPDRGFSENENRVLTTSPSVSRDEFLKGALGDRMEAYLADQFPARDGWTALRTACKKALLQKDIGGVYLARDGSYVEKLLDTDLRPDRIRQNREALLSFLDRASARIPRERLSFMPVPTPGYYKADVLPAGAALFSQDRILDALEEAFSACHFVDLRVPFAEGGGASLYYKTDHHWTTEGALLAYNVWRTSLGEPPFRRPLRTESFKGFRGTLYSKVLEWGAPADTLTLYRTPGDDGLSVSFPGTGKETVRSGCYFFDALREKDRYRVFFGGNYPLIRISGGADNGRCLLVVKDSYANCFLPFAVMDYETVLAVDPRFYLGAPDSLLEEESVTDVLVLYSLSNFLTDDFVSRLSLAPH